MIGYLDERIVMGRLLEDENNINRLLKVMMFPAPLKDLSKNKKIDALKEQAQHCKKVDPGFCHLTVNGVIAVLHGGMMLYPKQK